jgi:hypothetical protein
VREREHPKSENEGTSLHRPVLKVEKCVREAMHACGCSATAAYLRETLLHCSHKLGNERIEFLAAETRVSPANVQLVVEKGLIVGANVETDGQSVGWVNAGRHSVECQFPHRNAHASSALVPDSKNRLIICDDNQLHAIRAGRPQDGLDVPDITRGDPHSTSSAERAGIALARIAHRWSVHDWHEVGEVLAKNLPKRTAAGRVGGQ